MPQNSFVINEIEELAEITGFLTQKLAFPSLILLNGNLGAGKTTFAKYLLQQFGLQSSQVKSPTYSLINNFQGNFQGKSLSINHIDLYRLEQADPLLEEEIFQLLSVPSSVTLIEWPQKLNIRNFAPDSLQIIEMHFTLNLDNSRQITVEINP